TPPTLFPDRSSRLPARSAGRTCPSTWRTAAGLSAAPPRRLDPRRSAGRGSGPGRRILPGRRASHPRRRGPAGVRSVRRGGPSPQLSRGGVHEANGAVGASEGEEAILAVQRQGAAGGALQSRPPRRGELVHRGVKPIDPAVVCGGEEVAAASGSQDPNGTHL